MKISFRDPNGYIYKDGKRIFRAISKKEYENLKKIYNSEWYINLVNEKKIQTYKEINSLEDKDFITVEHEDFGYAAYSNEFCAEELYLSAKLTIDISLAAIKNNIILKDASAWNVVFKNSRPMFIDITSFEEWDKSRNWYAYGQFMRHFVIPLLAYKYTGINVGTMFSNHFDGLEPSKAKKILGIKSLFSFAGIEAVFLPGLIKKKVNLKIYKQNENSKENVNKKIIEGTLLRLKSYIEKLKPSKMKLRSKWRNYEQTRDHYSDIDLNEKKDFIKNAVSDFNNIKILDLGCNNGEFSLLVEKLGAKVVSCDTDEESLINFQSSLTNNENIVISNVDFCNPTPSIGYNNSEKTSFLRKSENYFDLILFLGIAHHLIVSNRVPLSMLLNTLSKITNKYLIFELIEDTDKKFLELQNQIKAPKISLNEKIFEKEIQNKFKINKKLKLTNSKRLMYLLEK